jgi:hypothetical protein
MSFLSYIWDIIKVIATVAVFVFVFMLVTLGVFRLVMLIYGIPMLVACGGH